MHLKIKHILIILPMALIMQISTVQAQLNAEVEGDTEITGDLRIKYNNLDNSNVNMMILERFDPGYTVGFPPFQITVPASTNTWSLDISQESIFSSGKNLRAKFNGELKLAITEDGGEINRPQSGTADLLPYAYGKIETDGTAILKGTLANYTVSRANLFHTTITFNDPVARDLVINVTPEVVEPPGDEFPPHATQVGIQYVSSATIRIWIYNSNGNLIPDAGFSFIAYKP